MTTPAFNQLIRIDPPSSDSSLSLDHRLNELQQVANDLRNERTFATPAAPRRPSRLRVVVGTALMNAGSALVASPPRRSIQTR